MMFETDVNPITIHEIIATLPSDSVLLDAFEHEGMLRIKVGITDFTQICQPVRQRIQLGTFNFRRICTDIIPTDMSGKICTAQLYQICE